MRLLRVELRRVVSRALVLFLVMAALAGVGAVLAGAAASVRPLSDAQLREAEAAYEFSVQDWEENGEQYMADCLEQLEMERDLAEQEGRDPDELEDWCADMEPRLEYYLPQPPELDQAMPMQLVGITTLFLLVAIAIGTTMTAAEMSTGAISTWLTFVPQRLRVFTSKVAAPAVFVAPMTALLLAAHLAALGWIYDRQGLADAMTAAVWTDTAWSGLRIVVLTVVVAAVGAALGLALRHTAAVLGLAAAYLVAVEGMLMNMYAELRPFSLTLNVEAWVNDGATYVRDTCTVTDEGTLCEGVETTLTLVQSSILLGGIAVVLIVVCAVVFRRRDVG